MANNSSFTDWLEAQMKEQGWSQAELARRAGVTRAAINGIITGARGPGNDLCVAIARAFKIAPETVFREAGLLPEVPENRAYMEEVAYLMGQLDDENKADVLAYMRHRLERQEQTRKKPPKRKPPEEAPSRRRKSARSVLKDKVEQ